MNFFTVQLLVRLITSAAGSCAFALIFKNAVQALMRRLFRRQDKED